MKPDLQVWAEQELIRLGCPELTESRFLDRIRNGLGGSHTVVTYPPLDSLQVVDGVKITDALETPSTVNYYAHVAFCEHLCPFCHYETELATGRSGNQLLTRYMDAVLREIDQWNARFTGAAVASVYIGGGTPTVLPTQRLCELFERLTVLRRADSFLSCIETSPMTATASGGEEKLQELARAGIGRVSIGVQSFDPAILRITRGHSDAVARSGVETVMRLPVTVNVDMIQDLPGQTAESVLNDLQSIEKYRPQQVSWYILRFRPEASWYSRFNRGGLAVPSASESLVRRLMIREGMRRAGYVAQPGGRFTAGEARPDVFKNVRSGLRDALIGVGASAYSHVGDVFFQNVLSIGQTNGIREYVDRVERGGSPIARGRMVDPIERTAGNIVTGIRRSVAFPDGDESTTDYLTEARATFSQLQTWNLVRADGSAFVLTDLGALFEEEICSLFYTASVKQALRERNAYWSNQ